MKGLEMKEKLKKYEMKEKFKNQPNVKERIS